MSSVGSDTRQAMTGRLCPDAGKPRCGQINAFPSAINGLAWPPLAREKRFAIAQHAEKGSLWFKNHPESGECRINMDFTMGVIETGNLRCGASRSRSGR
jgi:hypothetical protein